MRTSHALPFVAALLLAIAPVQAEQRLRARDLGIAPGIFAPGPHNAITIAHDYGVWTFPALAAGVERRIDFRQTRVWDGAGSRIFGAGAGAGRVPFTGPGTNTWTVAGLGTGIADLTRTEAWT